MQIFGEGPCPARVMLIGDFPGYDELHHQRTFCSSTGKELDRLLHLAGILRSEVYTTYAYKSRPMDGRLGSLIAEKKKDIAAAHVAYKGQYILPPLLTSLHELDKEIEQVSPNLIITLGELPFWALTGHSSITKWRGSQLYYTAPSGKRIKVIPTLNPAVIFRMPEQRPLILKDFKRAAQHYTYTEDYTNKPTWNFDVSPSFQQVVATMQRLLGELSKGPLWLDLDIETRYGHIDCIGFSWSASAGLCIPFISARSKEGYWSIEEEAHIVHFLYRFLTHPSVKIRWQNGLYDAQYIYRRWHFIPRNSQDTMISHHSVFAALPKSLATLASLYADWYVYWKDEGQIESGQESRRWTYNLQDCVYTRVCGESLTQTIEKLGLTSVDAQQQELFHPVLDAMLRGVRVIPEAKSAMILEVQEELSKREAFLYAILGHDINVASPKQMQTLFYEDLRQKPITKRVMIQGRVQMRPTVDDEALTQIAQREPLLKPLCNAIADIRTLNKFLNDFLLMKVDEDERMRCSFNIAGDAGDKDAARDGVKSAPYSYRLSSSKNPFDLGGNLQTIPSEKSKSSGKAAARGSLNFKLPNLRSMFGPDAGFTFFDMDLDRADLQVVVRESGETDWIAAMDIGVDMHLLNVYTLDGKEPPPLDELVESHPQYPEHRAPRKHKREFAKVFCHATNYLGRPKTVAAHTGRSIADITRAQEEWFYRHPGIKQWHERVIQQITKYHFVENRFGYRWYIFDRIDEQLYPQAVAWVPQCVPLDHEVLTPEGWKRIDDLSPDHAIAVWSPDASITFEVPSKWHFGEASSLVYMEGLGYHCTPNHRVPYRTGDNANIRVREASQLKEQARIPRTGMYAEGTLRPSNEELAYSIAFQADGHYDFRRDAIQFEFQKPRKIERLTSILNTLGIPYTKSIVRRGATTFYIPKGKHGLHRDLKYFGPWLLQLTAEALDFFLQELEFWDGWRSPQGELWYSSSVKTNCDWVTTVAALRGKRARWLSPDTRGKKPNYRVTIAPVKGKYSQVRVQPSERKGLVGCPTVSTGFFLIRYNGKISVTGNSTVGILINKIWCAFHKRIPEVQVLLQVHDSLAGQFPTHRQATLIPQMQEASRIVIPYDQPLIIPTGIKTSTISWGACE